MKGGGVGEWERMQVIGEQVKVYVQYGKSYSHYLIQLTIIPALYHIYNQIYKFSDSACVILFRPK